MSKHNDWQYLKKKKRPPLKMSHTLSWNRKNGPNQQDRFRIIMSRFLQLAVILSTGTPAVNFQLLRAVEGGSGTEYIQEGKVFK